MNVSGRYYSVFDLRRLFVHKQRLALNGAKLICWSTEISKTTGDILIYAMWVGKWEYLHNIWARALWFENQLIKSNFKVIVPPPKKTVPLFTHPHVIPNLYSFIASVFLFVFFLHNNNILPHLPVWLEKLCQPDIWKKIFMYLFIYLFVCLFVSHEAVCGCIPIWPLFHKKYNNNNNNK